MAKVASWENIKSHTMNNLKSQLPNQYINQYIAHQDGRKYLLCFT